MLFNPHPYQERMIHMIESGKSVALWADMGLGKSVSVLTAIENRIYDQMIPTKVLVLAPKMVAEETWTGEQQKWDHLKHLRVVKVNGTAENRLRTLSKDADVYVMCRNNLPWLFNQYTETKNGKWKWIAEWPFNIVVLDESSAFRSPSGTWFKTMARIQRSGCQIIELTGTPSPNGVDNLWAQSFLLDRGERLEKGITAFREKWMMPEKMINVGNRLVPSRWIPKPGAFDEIMNRLSDVSISLRAEDWLMMPDRIDNRIVVNLSAEEKKTYDKMERQALIDFEGDVVTAGSPGVVIGKLLQLANGRVYDEFGEVHDLHTRKLEALKELIEDATSPVLVFYSYKHDLDAILKAIPQARELSDASMIGEWNKGNIPVLVAHPASAGHGLNMQGGGNVIVWYGLPYNLEWYQQANARLYRQGQTAQSVIIHHIIAADTVDEAVMEALANKQLIQNNVLDAVRVRAS